MKQSITLLILFCGILACKERSKTPVSPPNETAADSFSTHLPVIDFLRSDMRLVDSFAGGIMKKVTTGGRKDSSYIKPEEFHRLAAQFLLKELDSAWFRDNFKETSLMDETSRMINFIYTAQTPETSLRKVLVYIEPSAVGNDQVDRIYMETESRAGDTLVSKKYNWKMRKYFYVLTIKQPETGAPLTTMEKVIWDPQHFNDE